jgi:hypothetical protein
MFFNELDNFMDTSKLLFLRFWGISDVMDTSAGLVEDMQSLGCHEGVSIFRMP